MRRKEPKMYSDMVENAAAVLSAKSGWNQEQSVEYIENMIFNSDEDIPGLLTSILNGSFEFHPPVRIRRGTRTLMKFMMHGEIVSAGSIRLRNGSLQITGWTGFSGKWMLNRTVIMPDLMNMVSGEPG